MINIKITNISITNIFCVRHLNVYASGASHQQVTSQLLHTTEIISTATKLL